MKTYNPNQFSLPRGVQAPRPSQPVPQPAEPASYQLHNNTNDILNPNKRARNQALFAPWGGDPNGNNEIGRMYHDLSAAWYPIAASRVGLANQLEPGRQANLQQLLYDASPQGQQTMVNDARARMQASAVDQGNAMAQYLGQSGAGIGAQQGAYLNALNQANQQAGNMQASLASPQGQMAMQQMLAQIYGEAQNPGLEPLQAMFGPIEARHQQNQAEQSQGGFLGSVMPILGQLGGMYAGGAFGARGGGGTSRRSIQSTGTSGAQGRSLESTNAAPVIPRGVGWTG